MPTLFYDDVIRVVSRTGAAYADRLLFNTPLSQAVALDASEPMQAIGQPAERYTALNIGDLVDVHLPAGMFNLFLEWPAEYTQYNVKRLKRIGVHLVAMQSPTDCGMAGRNLSADHLKYDRVWGTMIYLDRSGGVSTAPCAMVLGLSQAGRLLFWDALPITGTAGGPEWETAWRQAAGVNYLVCQCLGLIARSEALLQPTRPQRYRVTLPSGVALESRKNPELKKPASVEKGYENQFGDPAGPRFICVAMEVPDERRDATELMKRFEQELMTNGLGWYRANPAAIRVAPYVPPDWKILAGASHSVLTGLIFPPNLPPTDALYNIEEYELDTRQRRLSPVIATAFLLAARNLAKVVAGPEEKDNLRLARAIHSAACAAGPFRPLPTGDVKSPKRFSREDIRAVARRTLNSWRQAERLNEPLSSWATDTARVLLELSPMLWDVNCPALEIYERAAAHSLDAEDEPAVQQSGRAVAFLQFLASIAPLTSESFGIKINGVDLSLDHRSEEHAIESALTAWPKLLWLREMPADALHLLLPEGRIPTEPLPLLPDTELGIDPAEVAGVIRAIVEDAEANAAYQPHGYYSARLPSGSFLTQIGVGRLYVYCLEGKYYVRAGNPHMFGPILVFDRDNILQTAEDIRLGHGGQEFGLFMLSVAGLYRDVRVAGDQSAPVDEEEVGDSAEPIPEPQIEVVEEQTPAGPRRVKRITFPRGKYAKRQWGTIQEQQSISRHAHRVSGFKRKLRPGHKASERQRILAAEAGLILGADRTYVRPHVRGIQDKEASLIQSELTEASRVRLRGLITVLAYEKALGLQADDQAL